MNGKMSRESQRKCGDRDSKHAEKIIQNFHTIKFNDMKISVKNVCGLDSILHSICSIFIDQPHIFQIENMDVLVFAILTSYSKGDFETLYAARVNLLLKKGFGSLVNQSIDCNTNIYNVLSVVEMHSAQVKKICKCPPIERKIYIIEVNINDLKTNGISELQSCIIHSDVEEFDYCEKCSSVKTLQNRFSNIVFVDLQSIKSDVKSEISMENSLPKVRLSQVPTSLVLGNDNFILRSTIQYIKG